MANETGVTSIQMICEVCPEGQKLTAVAIKYEKAIQASSLSMDAYQVKERNVTEVYASEKAITGQQADAGAYVIIELSKDDPKAELAGYDKPGPGGVFIRPDAEVELQQVKDIKAADGSVVPAWEEAKDGEGEIEPLVELFTQHVFQCERNGRELPYNLYLPENYDENGKYPLLLYMHDRGPLDTNVKTTLRQGVGALVWVTPEFQKEYPCIVIAPQYSKVPRGDGEPDMIEATFDLVTYVMENYAVDKKRVYTTGQSMGCMTSIQMGIRRPDFFTAYLLVAGQWEPEPMKVLSDKKIFIIVSRGDPKAFPGMNASLELMKGCGAEIQYAAWDQDGGIIPEEQVAELRNRPGNIHYAVLKTEKRDVSCHMDTWKVAYNPLGVKEWLFEQVKE